MKKIIRKVIAFTVISTAWIVPALAETFPLSVRTDATGMGILKMDAPEVEVLKVDAPGAKAPGSVSVNLKLTLPEGADITQFYIYRVEEQAYRANCNISTDMSFSLEPGHYFFSFRAFNWGTFDEYFYVSGEEEILQDSGFEYDLNECVNHVSVSTYLPDGKEATPATYDASGYKLVDAGNVNLECITVKLMKRDRILTVDADEMQVVRKESGDGGYDEKGGSFWFNTLPEDMEIGFLRTFSIHDSNENVVVYDALRASDLSAETRVMNNPEEFRYVNGECGEIADETIMTEAPYRYYSVFIANHGRLTDLLGSGTTSTGKCDGNGIWVCADRKPGNDSELVFNYGRALAYETLEGGAPYFFPIFSFPMTFDEKGVHANAFISDRMMGEVELMTPEGGVDFFLDKPLCAHPRFSWVSETGDIPKFGNSIPALVAGSVWQSGFRFSMMHLFYLGRHGENRECDLHSGWSEVTVDGENVFQGGIGELIDWTKTEFSLPKANGRYEFVIDNDCAMVDGKVGVNHTVICCDASAEDREAPTLTMLNFRDRGDNVTDRFDNPDDCILEFSAADMSSEINGANLEWFSIGAPSSVKVEYAAEEGDSFKELPCEEDSELFYAPCFGAFYRVPFAGADMRSDTGWFKLRITLEDSTGNFQQQTISPAVYIGALASVTDVRDNGRILRDGDVFRADAPITLHDAAGRIVRTAERELSVAGLRGAYIVRSGGKSVKVIL